MLVNIFQSFNADWTDSGMVLSLFPSKRISLQLSHYHSWSMTCSDTYQLYQEASPSAGNWNYCTTSRLLECTVSKIHPGIFGVALQVGPLVRSQKVSTSWIRPGVVAPPAFASLWLASNRAVKSSNLRFAGWRALPSSSPLDDNASVSSPSWQLVHLVGSSFSSFSSSSCTTIASAYNSNNGKGTIESGNKLTCRACHNCSYRGMTLRSPGRTSNSKFELSFRKWNWYSYGINIPRLRHRTVPFKSNDRPLFNRFGFGNPYNPIIFHTVLSVSNGKGRLTQRHLFGNTGNLRAKSASLARPPMHRFVKSCGVS